MYNQLTPEIVEQLKAVTSYVFQGEDINPDYAKDETLFEYGHRIRCGLFAESADTVK